MTAVKRLFLGAAVAVAVAGGSFAASAQTSPEPVQDPIVLAEEASPGGSQEIVVGAGVGVLVGIVVAILLLASISD